MSTQDTTPTLYLPQDLVRPGYGGYRNNLDRFVQTHLATDGRDVLLNDPDGWEVDQPHLWWHGPAGGDGTGGPLGSTGPPPGGGWPAAAGRRGGVPAITRCTNLIADGIAMLPFHVYRGREKLPTPDWISDPQVQRPDGRVASTAVPDIRFSAIEFWHQVVVSMLWHGEAFIYTPVRDASGQPVAPLWLFHPDDVHIVGGRYAVGKTEDEAVTLDPEDLIVIRGMTRPGKLRGVGVLRAHMYDIGLAGKVRDYADGLLTRGIPAGYLKTSTPDLTESEAELLKSRWESAHGGTRKRIAVLSSTVDFTPLQIDPQTMQLVEMRRYSDAIVAMIFGVPMWKFGSPGDGGSSGGQMMYSNRVDRQTEWVQDGLMPWGRRIEAALDAQFPRGTETKISFDGMLRADAKSRYEAHKVGLDAGFLTVNEVRDLEDLPPLEGGDVAPDPPDMLSTAASMRTLSTRHVRRASREVLRSRLRRGGVSEAEVEAILDEFEKAGRGPFGDDEVRAAV